MTEQTKVGVMENPIVVEGSKVVTPGPPAVTVETGREAGSAIVDAAIELKITIDIDQMTIGDLELLERAGENELKITELIDFLDRVVVEDVRSLPITELGNVVQALNVAVGEASNPETAEGN